MARVGERVITVHDYDRMAAKLLAGPARGVDVSEPEARRKLLETMVSKELLLLEAERRALPGDPEMAAQLVELEDKLILKVLYDVVTRGAAEPEEVEARLFFYEEGFDEEVRVAHIMCATQEAAEQVLSDLAEGATFEDLAVERSTHRYSAWRGGDVGFVSSWYMLPELREVLLQLQPGQIHPEPVESSRGFHVFRALDRRKVGFEERREQVDRALLARRRADRIAAYTDSLVSARGLRCEAGEESPGAEASVCRWDGGLLSAAEYAAATGRAGGRAGAGGIAPRDVAARRILLAQARQRGYDRQNEVQGQLRQRREELVVDALHRQVTREVAATEDDLRAFYASHQEQYGPRPAVEVQEILAETRELAEHLRQRVQAGESMDELAVRYHRREATAARGGRMRLTTRKNAILGPLAPAALDGEVGPLYGPLEIPGGYSIFRVLAREQIPARSFEEVRPRLARIVALQLRNEAMDRLLVELREEYAARIKVDEESLGQVLQSYLPDTPAPEPDIEGGVIREGVW
ncbi:peptidylprolyl isomerase [Candidatus Latescibacterota bacterium]